MAQNINISRFYKYCFIKIIYIIALIIQIAYIPKLALIPGPRLDIIVFFMMVMHFNRAFGYLAAIILGYIFGELASIPLKYNLIYYLMIVIFLKSKLNYLITEGFKGIWQIFSMIMLTNLFIAYCMLYYYDLSFYYYLAITSSCFITILSFPIIYYSIDSLLQLTKKEVVKTVK